MSSTPPPQEIPATAIGAAGESRFSAALAVVNVSAAKLAPDPGEDFLVEVSGFDPTSQRTEPKTALVQVKTTTQDIVETGGQVRLSGIGVAHLRRWTAQPLPVFIVLMVGLREPDWYVESIDEIVTRDFSGGDVGVLTTKSTTVTLRRVDNIGLALTEAILDFHADATLDYDRLTTLQQEDRYFEVVRHQSCMPSAQHDRVNWTVIWRGPRRPQHFAAPVKQLSHLAKTKYSGTMRSTWVCFNLYRTRRKMAVNQPVAFLDWVDPDHPDGAELVAAWNGECPQIRPGFESDEVLEYLESKTGSPESFFTLAAEIGDQLDKITTQLVSSGVEPEGWTDVLWKAYREIDDAWEAGPIAPPELKVIESYVRGYLLAVHGHHRFFVDLWKDPDPRMNRWRAETVVEIAGYLLSVRRVIDALK